MLKTVKLKKMCFKNELSILIISAQYKTHTFILHTNNLVGVQKILHLLENSSTDYLLYLMSSALFYKKKVQSIS